MEFIRVFSGDKTFNVKVVNDAAKRNVKFYLEYSCILTADPKQRVIMQAIEKHRRDYPDFRKLTLRK